MKTISLVEDYEFEFAVARKALTTGSREAATGLTNVSAWLSLTDGGAAVGSTSTTLTERSATAGLYYGVLDAATINTALSSYVGRTVYEVFNVTGDSKRGQARIVVAISEPS